MSKKSEEWKISQGYLPTIYFCECGNSSGLNLQDPAYEPDTFCPRCKNRMERVLVNTKSESVAGAADLERKNQYWIDLGEKRALERILCILDEQADKVAVNWIIAIIKENLK